MALWKAALQSLEGIQTIGLDGVVTQQANYEKSGFVRAYANIRYQGMGTGGSDGVGGTSNDYLPMMNDPAACTSLAVVPLSEVPFEEVCSYDKPFFPADRTAFLKEWIHQPESTAWGILQKDDDDNKKLVGYGVIRRGRVG